MTPTRFTYGVYVPGERDRDADRHRGRAAGAGCNGYIGTKVAKVLGGDSPKVTIDHAARRHLHGLGAAGSVARRVWAGRAAA